MPVTIKFTLLFFVIIAVAAFIVKRALNARDVPTTVQEIVSEVLPIINDPRLLHKKVVRDLKRTRIYGEGTITDVIPSPETVLVRVGERIVADNEGAAVACDVVFELLFNRPDDPEEARIGHYVEFTGVLIDITAQHGVPVLSVEPGELLYIGDEPPEDEEEEDEVPEESLPL